MSEGVGTDAEMVPEGPVVVVAGVEVRVAEAVAVWGLSCGAR